MQNPRMDLWTAEVTVRWADGSKSVVKVKTETVAGSLDLKENDPCNKIRRSFRNVGAMVIEFLTLETEKEEAQ